MYTSDVHQHTETALSLINRKRQHSQRHDRRLRTTRQKATGIFRQADHEVRQSKSAEILQSSSEASARIFAARNDSWIV